MGGVKGGAFFGPAIETTLQTKMAALVGHRRAVSESALPLYCSSYGRRRCRASTLEYEKSKDKLALWVVSWDSDKICCLLQSLVARCSLQQLGYLWTALESVPHRDFLTSLEGDHSPLDHAPRPYTPLSTPVTRQVTAKLARSNMPQNKRLFRAQSTVINSEVVSPEPGLFSCQSEVLMIESRPTSPEATNPSKLPGLHQSTPAPPLTPSYRPHTTPVRLTRQSLPPARGQKLTLRSRTPISRCLTAPPSRVQSPVRRHLLCHSIPLNQRPQSRATNTAHTFTRSAFMSPSPIASEHSQLSAETLGFLAWFVQLPQAWQQQELLQLLVTNLDHRELYYLATLLMSRQYRDFVTNLPEALVVMVMAYVPAKDILRHCCLVSRDWNTRCNSNSVWKRKVQQRRMGLPLSNFLTWKSLYLDDLRLKRNWTRGLCAVREIDNSKVLGLAVRDGMLATGGADRTVRVWKLCTGECLAKLHGHMRGVWSVCFYGRNFVISGSGDHTVKLWNYRTGICERTLTGHIGTVWSLRQKGEVLISGSHDKTPHLLSPKAQLKWRQVSHLPQAMVFAQAVCVGETVYYGSGTTTMSEGDGGQRYKIFSYDLSSDKWRPVDRCPVVGFGMSNFMDQLTLVGGAYESSGDGKAPYALTGDVYTYDETSGEYERTIPTMPTARLLPTLMTYGSTLTACGGVVLDEKHDICVSTVEVYSSENMHWYRAEPLPMACTGMSYATIQEHSYLLGGFTDTDFDHPTISVFSVSLQRLVEDALTRSRGFGSGGAAALDSPTPKIWQRFQDAPRYAATATSIGGCLVAIGGSDDSLEHKSGALHVYSPLTNAWSRMDDIPVMCFSCAVTRLPKSELVIIGGMGHDEEDALKTVFRGRVRLD